MKRRNFTAIAAAATMSCSRSLRAIVGSKEGAEGMLIGEICGLLLERKLKAKIERRLALGNTSTLFQAIQNGDVHVYTEYARQGFQVFFKAEDPMDPAMSTQKLKELFRRNANSEWLAPLGFESNYMVIVRADDPTFANFSTLSEVSAEKSGWKFGFGSDFSQSPEGYSSFKDIYGLAERTGPRIEPLGQLYFGLKDKRIELMVTTSTDPLARAAGYKVLSDDKGVFARNSASLLVHGPTAEEHPEFLETLKLLSGKFSNDEILRLNGEVVLKKRAIAEVAAEWFGKSGLG